MIPFFGVCTPVKKATKFWGHSDTIFRFFRGILTQYLVFFGFQIPNNGRHGGYWYLNLVPFIPSFGELGYHWATRHLSMGCQGAIKSPGTLVMDVTHPSKNTRKRQRDTHKWYQGTLSWHPFLVFCLVLIPFFGAWWRVSIHDSLSETPKFGAPSALAPLFGACELPLWEGSPPLGGGPPWEGVPLDPLPEGELACRGYPWTPCMLGRGSPWTRPPPGTADGGDRPLPQGCYHQNNAALVVTAKPLSSRRWRDIS